MAYQDRFKFDPTRDRSEYLGTPRDFFGVSPTPHSLGEGDPDDSLSDIFPPEEQRGHMFGDDALPSFEQTEQTEQPVAPEGILQQILQNPNIQRALAIGGAGLAGPFAAQAAGKQFDASEAQRRQQKQLKLENEARARQELRDIENLKYEREKAEAATKQATKLFDLQSKATKLEIEKANIDIDQGRLEAAEDTLGGFINQYLRKNDLEDAPSSMDGFVKKFSATPSGKKLIAKLGDNLPKVYEASRKGYIEDVRAGEAHADMLEGTKQNARRIEFTELNYDLNFRKFEESVARQDYAQAVGNLEGVFYDLMNLNEQTDQPPINTLEQAEAALISRLPHAKSLLTDAGTAKHGAFSQAHKMFNDVTIRAKNKVRDDARDVIWKQTQLGIQTAQSVFDIAEIDYFEVKENKTVDILLTGDLENAQKYLGRPTLTVPAEDAALTLQRLHNTFGKNAPGLKLRETIGFATQLANSEFTAASRAHVEWLGPDHLRPEKPSPTFLIDKITEWKSAFEKLSTDGMQQPEMQPGMQQPTEGDSMGTTGVDEVEMQSIKESLINTVGMEGYDEAVKAMSDSKDLTMEEIRWLVTHKFQIRD